MFIKRLLALLTALVMGLSAVPAFAFGFMDVILEPIVISRTITINGVTATVNCIVNRTPLDVDCDVDVDIDLGDDDDGDDDYDL